MPGGDPLRCEALTVCRLVANAYAYRLSFLDARLRELRQWNEHEIEIRGATSPFWVQFLEDNLDEYQVTGPLQLMRAKRGAESALGKKIRADAAIARPLTSLSCRRARLRNYRAILPSKYVAHVRAGGSDRRV
jgi:hypothetical protein